MITKEQIHSIVEEYRQDAIDCLRDIVQTPSNTTEEVEVSKVFCRWLEKMDLTPQVIGIAPEHPNVFAELKGSQPGKRFLFNGHMDAFPPVPGDPGLYGPYSGKIVDGHLYGRGSCDMKGGDCAALMAVGLLKKLGFDPKGSVVLSYMCDEEIGGRYGAKWLSENGYLEGDFGICMEPTCRRVMYAHNGIYRVMFTYRAPASSSGVEHPTKNALEKAVIAINALYEYREKVRKICNEYGDKPSFSITTLNAGSPTATNIHASEANFSIDYRLVPGQDRKQVKKEIFAVLDGLKEKDPLMEYSWEIISDRPALECPKDSAIVKACCEAFEEVTGEPAVLYRSIFGSDAATIQAHNGILMPNFGAAKDVEECTKPNEKINIDHYVESIEYYMLTVVKMMS